MAALSAGYEITVSGVTLDRFCGGGITSVNLAAATVMSGMEDCVVAGGTEMMSYTARSEEHTSELQSLMRISYAVFCLKKKKTTHQNTQPAVLTQHVASTPLQHHHTLHDSP